MKAKEDFRQILAFGLVTAAANACRPPLLPWPTMKTEVTPAMVAEYQERGFIRVDDFLDGAELELIGCQGMSIETQTCGDRHKRRRPS